MERKRRERINTSLSDLARLLTEAHMVKTEAGKATKLEKADILELTVKHIRNLKSQDSAQSKEENTEGQEETKKSSSSYQEGFTRCMRVVEQSLKKAGKESLKERLLTHLNTCLQTLQPPPTSPDSSDDVQVPSRDAEKADRHSETPSPLGVKPESAGGSIKQEGATGSASGEVAHRLTLVPTRLPSGSVAFVVQGGIDPNLLLPQDCNVNLSPTTLTNTTTVKDDNVNKTTADSSTERKSSDEFLSDKRGMDNVTADDDTNLTTSAVPEKNIESATSCPGSLVPPASLSPPPPAGQIITSPASPEESSSPVATKDPTPLQEQPTLAAVSIPNCPGTGSSSCCEHPSSSTPATIHCPPLLTPAQQTSYPSHSAATQTQYFPASSSSSTVTQFPVTVSISSQSLSASTVVSSHYSPISELESTQHNTSTSTSVSSQYSTSPVSSYLAPASFSPPHFFPPSVPTSHNHPTPTVSAYTGPSHAAHIHTPPTPPPSVSPQSFHHCTYQLQVSSSEEDMYTEEEEDYDEDVDMEESRGGAEEGPYDLSVRRMWRPW